jgi:hypothetical protein
MTGKKENRISKSVNLWRPFYAMLRAVKETHYFMSDALERCLTSEVKLTDILGERGIKKEFHPCPGAKIVTLSFHADVVSRMDEIKEVLPGFSNSVLANFSSMFRGITVYSILEIIKPEALPKDTEDPRDPEAPIPENILQYVRQIFKKH